jgi:hexosaminidase
MRTFTILFILLLANIAFAQICPITPQPSTYREMGGEKFIVTSITGCADQGLDEFIKTDLLRFWNFKLNKNIAFGDGGKHMKWQRIQSDVEDYYSINVSDKIEIKFSSNASRFYALQSLKQLILQENGEWVLPHCFIEDSPTFRWRGLHLDVSRHFFTASEVKQFLDQMAVYKFNTFHWHLTDDQGWRIEIKKYPKLTEVGSVRKETLIGHASADPEKHDGQQHKGFYTQKEIKEIVEYARKRHITVVPEIEMPGHARAALAAYPEYSCTGELLPVAQKWGVFDHVYCSKPETINFLKDILREVISLFPGDYLHVGGDEVPKEKWTTCSNCKKVKQENNLKDEDALQAHFLSEINGFLKANNRKMIGWDEILDGGGVDGAAIMCWRGEDKALKAINRQVNVVQSPNAHLYFDHYQSKRSAEPLAIGGYTNLQEVYCYNPLPAGLMKGEEKYVLGAQANLWTEYIPDFHQLQYMMFPRVLALSEILWSKNKLSFADFKKKTIEFTFPRLDEQGINYAKSIFETEYELRRTKTGIQIVFTPGISGGDLFISKADENHENYCKLNRVSRPQLKVLNAKVIKEGKFLDSLGLKVLQHSTLGNTWVMTPESSSFYKGTNDFVLSDGIKGQRPWNGSEWLGFRDSIVNLQMRFNKLQKSQSITMGFLSANSSWIYLPELIEIQYTKNGRKWKKTETQNINEETLLTIPGDFIEIRIRVKSVNEIPKGKEGAGHLPWLFMDEIYFRPTN